MTEVDKEKAADIVRRCGLRDGLFKGPRTLNAVETIAYALTEARADTETRILPLIRHLVGLASLHPDWCSECKSVGELVVSGIVPMSETEARADERKDAVAETWKQAINIVKLTRILSDDIHELSQGGTVTEIQIPFTAGAFKEIAVVALEAARDGGKP